MDVNVISCAVLTQISGGQRRNNPDWQDQASSASKNSSVVNKVVSCYCDEQVLQKIIDVYQKTKNATLRQLINHCLPDPVNRGGIVGVNPNLP